MKVIVCDASPLVFLAKLDRLNLISCVLQGEVFVLKCVADELVSDSAGTLERARLDAFLADAQVIDFQAPVLPSRALSRCDQSTLSWANDNGADWLVADERLLRRVAQEHGLATIGFVGLLLEGVRKGLLSPGEARGAIDDAVARHGCRISVALYQRILAELDTLAGG